jgi:hypothetical protein
MDYKVVSIIDEHNHPPVGLTSHDLALATKSIAPRRIWLKVWRQRDDSSSESSQGVSDGEEEAPREGLSRRMVSY